MDIELLYFEGCPNWKVAEARLGELAGEFPLRLTRTDVGAGNGDAPSDARFRGSPTVLIDGRDPFPAAPTATGLTCRIYSTPDGPAGSPTTDQLRAALSQVRGSMVVSG